MGLARKNICGITPYIAGKAIEETKREYSLKNVIKLASNENPLGPSPKAIEAVKKHLLQLNRYPDSSGYYLRKKIAKYYNLGVSDLILGNGSDELIDIIIKTFVSEEENVVTADITFLEYELMSRVNNRQVIKVPLRYFKYDLTAIKNKLNRKSKLVFIANPNNPTGTYLNKDELDDFIRDVPEETIIVLDEAYDNFIDVNDYQSGLSYIKRKNLLVLKTFSKAYGLAGLRIGFAAGRSELISYMQAARQPFNVNSLAQAAAYAALDDRRFLEKSKKTVLEGKRYLYSALSRMGIAYLPSVANFILLDTGKDGLFVSNALLRQGVIVRDMKQYGLKKFIRVTIGTKRENERFIRALKKVL